MLSYGQVLVKLLMMPQLMLIVLMLLSIGTLCKVSINTYKKISYQRHKGKDSGAGANSSGTPTVDANTGRIIYPDGYIFNGVMGAAQWCSCPAMVLLDLLLDTRYGFGNHITESSLDLFSFVTAKFANTLVSDGLRRTRS